MPKTIQLGLDKRTNHINRLNLDYSELREKEKSKHEQENYEKLISLSVDQKHRIQEIFFFVFKITLILNPELSNTGFLSFGTHLFFTHYSTAHPSLLNGGI